MQGFNREVVTFVPHLADNTVLTGATLVANQTTKFIDIAAYFEAIVFIVITANSGTTPTLDCKIQYSPDSINWLDSGDSFTQMTTVNGTFLKKLTANFGKYIRLVITLGGTTPSYTVSVSVLAKL